MASESSTTGASLTTEQAAEFLALSPYTLATWRGQGKGPTFCKFGKYVTYDPADLIAFRDSTKIRTSGGK